SGKTGENVDKILEAVVREVPPPKGAANSALQTLVFDSKYDKHQGVIAYIRVVNGSVKTNDKIKFINTGTDANAIEVGYFAPELKKTDELDAGEVGYIVTGLREVSKARVGDTITTLTKTDKQSTRTVTDGPQAAVAALPGYKEIKPMVFASIFPESGDDYPALRDAMDKLKLNDASLSFAPESIPSLGFGFRTGFLGLLHMDIVRERLSREFNLDLVLTAPSVAYKITKRDGVEIMIYNPSELPDPSNIESLLEPWVNLDIIVPEKYLGGVMNLVTGRRGIYKNTAYLGTGRLNLHFEIPLANIVIDFYDKLKSISSGYASMNYDLFDWREADLVKLDILVAEDRIDAMAMIVHRSIAEGEGRRVVEKLKELIPKQQFPVALQAAIGGKIIARETLAAMRKDVTAGLYGGDVTRKMKVLKKQKKGKARLKAQGRVDIPQEAFISLLKR
ncbi:MAG: elongation factor 4, partial [Candidatus Doudnabacteria bacterium RIFCSPHIGHO2_01_FULL_49_9]